MTEHLQDWEGEASALPEWTSGIDVEDDEDEEQSSCNTRKDRCLFCPNHSPIVKGLF